MNTIRFQIGCWIIVLGWFVAGIFVGVVFGTLFWWIDLTISGKRIEEALRGQVEDAISTLQAMILLGCLVGGPIGLVWGWGSAAICRQKHKERAEHSATAS
jgi:hypothetical protein